MLVVLCGVGIRCHYLDNVLTWAISLTFLYQDFDKIHKERVTRAQFASVMDKMQLSLPPAEMDVLMATFADPRGDVDYIGFCNTVDPAY